MMRTFILESAAPYVDTDAVPCPAAWPDWDRRQETAATPFVDDGQDGPATITGGGDFGGLREPRRRAQAGLLPAARRPAAGLEGVRMLTLAHAEFGL
ncbi:hypothetical protein ACIRQF_00205 [Streptomyces sp. NPDC101191]|uniref:hypothetical protein n=1 Tax=Streptomyces sp. NPDC101191 TaxID=3366126 RepID=UPI003822EB24